MRDTERLRGPRRPGPSGGKGSQARSAAGGDARGKLYLKGVGGDDHRDRGRLRRAAVLVPGPVARRRCGPVAPMRAIDAEDDAGTVLRARPADVAAALLARAARAGARGDAPPGSATGRPSRSRWRHAPAAGPSGAWSRSIARRLRPLRSRQYDARGRHRLGVRSTVRRRECPRTGSRCAARARATRRSSRSTRPSVNVPVPGARVRAPHAGRLHGGGGRTLSAGARGSFSTMDLRMVYHVGSVEVHALAAWTSRSGRGSSWPSSGPRVAASRRSCTCWAAWPGPPRGRIIVDGVEISVAGDAERTRDAAREDRLRLPALQPAADPDRARQPGDRAADPGAAARRPSSVCWSCWRWWGCPTRCDMKPLDLSAGEQQRVAIARALVNQPGHPPGRRAHRQPRLGEQRADPRSLQGPEPAAAARPS